MSPASGRGSGRGPPARAAAAGDGWAPGTTRPGARTSSDGDAPFCAPRAPPRAPRARRTPRPPPQSRLLPARATSPRAPRPPRPARPAAAAVVVVEVAAPAATGRRVATLTGPRLAGDRGDRAPGPTPGPRSRYPAPRAPPGRTPTRPLAPPTPTPCPAGPLDRPRAREVSHSCRLWPLRPGWGGRGGAGSLRLRRRVTDAARSTADSTLETTSLALGPPSSVISSLSLPWSLPFPEPVVPGTFLCDFE